MRFRNKKHLFFDLDHTLWDFEQNALECLTELFDIFNLSEYGISSEQFYRAFSPVNQLLWYQLEQQEITHDYLRKIRFQKCLSELGICIDDSNSERMNEGFLELLPFKSRVTEKCFEVLEALLGKYRLHILSNGYQEVQLLKMKSSGLLPFFDKIITNELAGARKPDRRIFEFALQETGATASESIIIGDSLEADIKGGLNAGWDVIHFHEAKAELPDNRYLHVNRLHQILPYF